FSVKHESAGIERKTRKYEQEAKEAKPLSQKATELSEKADVILAKLAELESAGVQVAGISRDLEKAMGSLGESPGAPAGRASVGLDGGDLVVRGKLIYEDYECYNCHKIGGLGGKKRGPKLDNIGNLVTPVQLKDKIFNPEAWYAEGFEKRTKDKMPDTYRDLMSDKELEALVSYLMTLKDPTVDTPKPVFPSKS
ncbi:MAG: c-type cytochrome, partial [Nitrospirales bacterium]